MSKLVVVLFAGLAALTVSTAAMAEPAGLKPEDQINYRQAAYKFAAWNMSKLKALLEAPQLNKEEASKAAQAVATVANSGLGALFGPGTEKDIGKRHTHVKPELFQQSDKVKEFAISFSKEANELAKVAATGDAPALKVQLGKVGETCKACHDKFRNKD